MKKSWRYEIVGTFSGSPGSLNIAQKNLHVTLHIPIVFRDARAMAGQGGRRETQGHPRQKTSEANRALGRSGGPPLGDFLRPRPLEWLKMPSRIF